VDLQNIKASIGRIGGTAWQGLPVRVSDPSSQIILLGLMKKVLYMHQYTQFHHTSHSPPSESIATTYVHISAWPGAHQATSSGFTTAWVLPMHRFDGVGFVFQ
jgi:hypothetical protein